MEFSDGLEDGRVTSPNVRPSDMPACIAPHDCYAWQRAHYVSRPEYQATVCGSCDKIIGFRWRSWRKRLRSLFTSEPDHKTAD